MTWYSIYNYFLPIPNAQPNADATKVVMLPALAFGLQALASSPAGYWGFPLLFLFSGLLIFGSSLFVLLALKRFKPGISLLVLAIVQTLGRVTIGLLFKSLPKFFLLSLFEEDSPELAFALSTTYAYMSVVRFGPLQFAFTTFLFFTADERQGEVSARALRTSVSLVPLVPPSFSSIIRSLPLFYPHLTYTDTPSTSSVGLTIIAFLVAALAAVPLFKQRLREAMARQEQRA